VSFGILMQVSDRQVVGIGELDEDIGFTTADVAPDYAVVVIDDDSQYVNTYSEASAYVCTDGLTVQPLVPC
jgi:hypothetical protein